MLKYIQTNFPDSTGIVYCMTKADCEETADFLRENKVLNGTASADSSPDIN
jgi:superfamily II DNA helicase RecQ